MGTSDFSARRVAFQKLHASGCFVIPNPWDVGTARYLRHLGFQALATTSSGLAFSLGLPDSDWAVPLQTVLSHIAEIVASVDLPVNADFESGYAHDLEGVARNVRLCVETGVAGLSIEDSTGDRVKPLYDLPVAVERMKALRAEGLAFDRIAERLDAEGVSTRTGKRWHGIVVNRILTGRNRSRTN